MLTLNLLDLSKVRIADECYGQMSGGLIRGYMQFNSMVLFVAQGFGGGEGGGPAGGVEAGDEADE